MSCHPVLGFNGVDRGVYSVKPDAQRWRLQLHLLNRDRFWKCPPNNKKSSIRHAHNDLPYKPYYRKQRWNLQMYILFHQTTRSWRYRPSNKHALLCCPHRFQLYKLYPWRRKLILQMHYANHRQTVIVLKDYLLFQRISE